MGAMGREEKLYYKDYKLVQWSEHDDDRWYVYHSIYKNKEHTSILVDCRGFIGQNRFQKLVDMNFPTRKDLPSIGPLNREDINTLYDRYIDSILLGGSSEEENISTTSESN